MKRGFWAVLFASVLIVSCERTDDSPVDVDYTRPFLHDLEISPESFNTDTILVNGGTDPSDMIDLSLSCVVVVDRPTGSLPPTVTYRVTLPSEGTLYDQGEFRDDGSAPDISAGDGIYSGNVTFTIERVNIGDFQIAVTGYHDPASPSNTVLRSIDVFRSSRAPSISDLAAPDTVQLPPSGQVALILMSVAAADSDGLGDIDEVYFRNLDSPTDTTRRFLLLDDGHVNGISGDSVANDGIFSIIVQLPSGTPALTYRFFFEAVDRSGLLSNYILHPFTVMGPE